MLIRFLNETQPAKLLLWSAVAITVAALLGIIRIYINTGVSFNEAQEFYEYGKESITIVSSYDAENDRSGLIRFKSTLAFILGVGAFVSGVAGGLLPMWAVGRLISDSIREGHTHD